MSSKTIKYILIILSFLNTNITIKADWLDEIASGVGNMIIEGVDASARTDVQKALIDVKNLSFSTELRDKFFKEGQKFGLSNPSVAFGIAKIQQDFKLKSNSPFLSFININPLKMANGYLYPFYINLLQEERISASKNKIEDYLSPSTLHFLSNIDPEGLITLKLLSYFKENPSFASYIDLNPEALKILVKEIDMISYIDLPYLHYFTNDINTHSSNFKKGTILNPYDLNFNIVDGNLSLSSSKGQIAIFNSKSNVFIASDIALLNCQLPPSSKISFNNSVISTDKLGRIETIEIEVKKNKFKDLFKRSLKSSQILNAKNRANSKGIFLHPKDLGGVETWSNIFAIENSKENKESLKKLEKWIKENSKTGNKILTVKLKYPDSSDQPNSIQYFEGNNLICSLR